MPLVLDSEYQGANGGMGSPSMRPEEDPWKPAPTFGDALGPAFRQGNPIASAIDLLASSRPDMAPDPAYKVFDDPAVKGTKYETDHAQVFLGSPNAAYTGWLKSRIDRETKDRELLASAGWGGTVAMLAAGLVDPFNLIPATAAVSRTRTAAAFAEAGLKAGVGSELALQGSQYTREGSESLSNIASSTIVMGLMGAAVGKFMTPVEARAVSDEIADIRGVVRDVPDTPTGLPQAGGAAASDLRTLKPVSIGFDKLPEYAARMRETPYVPGFLADAVEGIGNIATRTSPTMRTFFQDTSVAARRAMADLAETSLRFVDNTVGVPTTYQGAISRLVTNGKIKMQIEAEGILQDMWKQHAFDGGEVPRMAVARSNLSNMLGQEAPQGKLAYKDFGEEVSRALWSGDTHAVPQVQQAAQTIRQRILDPLGKAAVEAGLLTEAQLKPRGDVSWFARMWNKEAITANRNDTKRIFADWYAQEQEVKAAAQIRLQDLAADHAGHVNDIERLEAKIDAIQNKAEVTGVRLSERAMEARATEKRAATVEMRLGEVQQSISELEEFLADLKRTMPDARAQVSDLETELAQLRKEASPLSKAEESRIARDDIARVLPDEEWREAAELFTGRRKDKAGPSLVQSIVDAGGVNDIGGDIAHIIGRGGKVKGLLNPAGKTLDEIGENIWQTAPWAWGGARPSTSDIIEAIRESHAGREPSWWREAISGQQGDDKALRVESYRGVIGDLWEALDYPKKPTTLRGVVEMMQMGAGDTPGVLNRLYEKAAAGRQIPGAERVSEMRMQALDDLRGLVERAREDKGKLQGREAVAGARASEAGMGANRNRGRLELLQDRLDTQEKIKDVYAQTVDLLEKRRVAIREKIEAEIADWKGNSSKEAIAALEKRAEQEATRTAAQQAGTYKGRGERLRSADKAIDRAVRHIIDSERGLTRAELESRADETINRILGSPDGRLPYDDASGGPKVGYTGKDEVGDPRGSWAAREFAIPTEHVAHLVERDPMHVINGTLRTLLPDIEIAKRFGDVDMTEVFRKINEDFSAKAAGLKDGSREMVKLDDLRKRTIADVAAVRDRIRGVYGYSADPTARKAGRIANAARNLGAMTDLGSSTLNSMADIAGPVYRYGFMSVFKDGWMPLFQHMVGMETATPAVKRQLKAMGIALETHTNLRGNALNDIVDGYRPGTPFERALSYGAEKSQILNLQAPWTDVIKTVTASAAMQEVLAASERVALGKATANDITKLAAASIDPQKAAKIWSEHIAPGGHDEIKGTRIPNTDNWKDRSAAQAFENAIAREADIAVVTPGQEKPLWMSKPVAGLIGQFKSFLAGAHERMVIAQLQQRDINTLQGLMTGVAMGMLSYRLYTLASGKPASDKPQDWIKEGISRSTVLGWADEINSQTAKVTGGKADLYRLIGADKEMSRFASRSVLSSLLGPAAGKVEGLAGITRSIATGEANASDITAMRRLVPLQNHFAVRRLLNEVEDGIAHSMGIEPADRTKP